MLCHTFLCDRSLVQGSKIGKTHLPWCEWESSRFPTCCITCFVVFPVLKVSHTCFPCHWAGIFRSTMALSWPVKKWHFFQSQKDLILGCYACALKFQRVCLDQTCLKMALWTQEKHRQEFLHDKGGGCDKGCDWVWLGGWWRCSKTHHQNKFGDELVYVLWVCESLLVSI